MQIFPALRSALLAIALLLVCGSDAGAEDELPCAGECGEAGPGCTVVRGDSYSTQTVSMGQTLADNPTQPGRLYRRTCTTTYTATSTVCLDANGNVILHTAGIEIRGPACTIEYL